MDERREQKIEASRRAVAIRNAIQEKVQERQDNIMSALVAQYRMGEFPHDRLVGLIGEFTALADLMTNLEYEFEAGTREEMQEIEDG